MRISSLVSSMLSPLWRSDRSTAGNWACAMTIRMRADEAPMLFKLLEQTDLGHPRHVPARRTSKPQIAWTVGRRDECARLVELLEEHPLRSRKRREFEVWAQAVRALDDPELAADVLPAAFNEIRERRRYVNPPVELGMTHAIELPRDYGYIGGFFTGEGYLRLSERECRAVVHLRDDDRPLLDALAAATGLGTTYSHGACGSSRPAASWVVLRHDELLPAIELFERAGLRGRRGREFAIWRQAALEFAGAGRRRNRGAIARFAERLHEAREYSSVGERPTPKNSTADIFAETSIAALQQTARVTGGAVTCTSYEAVRRANPHWPNRNTIVKTFGSWRAALTLAGLEDRASSRPRGNARPSRPDPERDQARRALVIDAVRELSVQLARPPTVAEYLEWRAANDTTLPALRTTYRLFPDGWSSVLERANERVGAQAAASRACSCAQICSSARSSSSGGCAPEIA
jgi:hypothetical protein